ncbi:hypothetical protein O1Q96_00965 (plasmid) [Streptomyces sp. Qhu-G9]|uniref:hypothetical protein n=1 Tax=Streptomyces sp. Qhu-G9 TaxID=3452799 RepID=UPI0022ABE5E0|nr:hypothetical protein [Streptomyces aurantiacus]WAU78442.1 hypothetical protein O1Q96_00965 [Streptomyces aurantiacus]
MTAHHVDYPAPQSNVTLKVLGQDELAMPLNVLDFSHGIGIDSCTRSEVQQRIADS